MDRAHKVMMITMVVSVIMDCLFGVVSLVVWSNNEHNPCLGDGDLADFDYMTWLLWFGITIFIVNFVVLPLSVCFIWASSAKHNTLLAVTAVLLSAFSKLAIFFQFAWFVVGAILYFTQVHTHCPAGGALRDYGLALFILQSINFTCGFFIKRATNNNNALANQV